MTIHTLDYQTLCRRFHHSSRATAEQILADKDREHPGWIPDLCKKPESINEMFLSMFSCNDVVNAVCVTVLACMLISISSTRFTLHAAQQFLSPEATVERISTDQR